MVYIKWRQQLKEDLQQFHKNFWSIYFGIFPQPNIVVVIHWQAQLVGDARSNLYYLHVSPPFQNALSDVIIFGLGYRPGGHN